MIFLRDDLFCRFLFGKLVYNLRDVGRNFKKGWRVIENDILDLEKCENKNEICFDEVNENYNCSKIYWLLF